MNELISGFRDVLNAHLAGRLDLNAVERELITCIKQEPDFAATYGALIEARHRTNHLSEDSFLRLMRAARGTMQSLSSAAVPLVADERTRMRPASSAYTNPAAGAFHDGTLAREPTHPPAQPIQTHEAHPTDASARAHTGPSVEGHELSAPHSPSGWNSTAADAEVSTAQPVPGTVIKNRFELVDIIGQGGMGLVFKARDRLKVEAGDRNPFIAIKILSEEFRRHPHAFRALQREARKAQKLAHPNIATVFDFERDGDTVFMHMELLEGESLELIIRRYEKTGLSARDALRITQGLCAALAYAHQQHIIHSDFKPANAYLTRDGVVKVLDFGIARATRQHTTAWPVRQATTLFDPKVLGALTPAYASCEMIEGQEPDPRDDVYGLAVVTYELLTGKHPFGRVSAVNARDAKLTPRPVRSLSMRQWSGLRRALSFDRQHRTPSVEKFLSEVAPHRISPLVWTGTIAASVATLGLLSTAALWSMIVLSDKDSIWLHRTLTVLSALPEGPRTTILAGDTRNILVQGFHARIEKEFDPDKQRYNAPEAQRLVARLSALLPDSRAVDELSRKLNEQRRRELRRLSDRFAEYLEKGWLIAAQNPENADDVLAIVRQIDPANALLTDERLAEAYLGESDRAAKAGNLALARELLDFGRRVNPEDPRVDELASTIDRQFRENLARTRSLNARAMPETAQPPERRMPRLPARKPEQNRRDQDWAGLETAQNERGSLTDTSAAREPQVPAVAELSPRERKKRDAEREALKQNLLSQTEADEVADAIDTFRRLTEILEPTDPFLSDARNEIGQSYLDLAEAAEKEGRRVDAVNLVQRASELVPESKRVQFLRSKYSSRTPAPDSVTPMEAARLARGVEGVGTTRVSTNASEPTSALTNNLGATRPPGEKAP